MSSSRGVDEEEEEQVNLWDQSFGANLVLLHASYLLIIIFKAFYNCKPEIHTTERRTKYFTNMLKTFSVLRINYDVICAARGSTFASRNTDRTKRKSTNKFNYAL